MSHDQTLWVGASLLLLAPLLPLALTIYNLVSWRRPGGPAEPAWRFKFAVSVLIPARNEEHRLEAAVCSALAQGPFVREVLVYDDGSTDGTRALVQRLAALDPRVRLIVGTELPDGWVGKPHACHKLLGEAVSELVLFMDADVRLERGGLCSMVDSVEGEIGGASVVTAVPRQIVGSFGERLIVPLLHLTYTSWLPLHWAQSQSDPRFVAANGQLLLARREVLEKLGGFEPVRAEIVDDVAFCRHAKRSGAQVLFLDGHRVATCRMYTTAAQVWSGFCKNLFEGLGSPLALAFALALHLACFLFPYGVLALSIARPETSLGGVLAGSFLPFAFVGVAQNVLLRLLLAVRYRQPWEGVVLHPISIVSLLLLALHSTLLSYRGKLSWADRSYKRRSLRVLGAASPRAESAVEKPLQGRL